jgi:hypothetical protein
MARLTFRADDELVRQLEEMDSSQSEVMREALRQYLSTSSPSDDVQPRTFLRQSNSRPVTKPAPTPNIHVNISLRKKKTESPSTSSNELSASGTCSCGNEVETSWAFCPACGRRTRKQEI